MLRYSCPKMGAVANRKGLKKVILNRCLVAFSSPFCNVYVRKKIIKQKEKDGHKILPCSPSCNCSRVLSRRTAMHSVLCLAKPLASPLCHLDHYISAAFILSCHFPHVSFFGLWICVVCSNLILFKVVENIGRNNFVFTPDDLLSKLLKSQGGIEHNHLWSRYRAWISKRTKLVRNSVTQNVGNLRGLVLPIKKPIFMAFLNIKQKSRVHVCFFGSATFLDMSFQCLHVSS